LLLRQRVIATTGSLTANEADLIQQGARGIDLAGNEALSPRLPQKLCGPSNVSCSVSDAASNAA
jgi:hypothetical protein